VVRGFLGDTFNEYSRFSEDSRFASVPYFTPEAIEKHMELLFLVREWARKKDATPAQIALAWVLAQKPFIVPIPGTTKLHHMKENLGAYDVRFTTVELTEFRQAFEKIELVGFRSPDSVLADR
jgi:aryl-alcohol dehydrogenase-like predicted oxidoreductase